VKRASRHRCFRISAKSPMRSSMPVIGRPEDNGFQICRK
jgi:hypothetical protein